MPRSFLIAALASFALSGATLAQQVDIGVASTVSNRVLGSVGGRTLKSGDRVFQNENIETGADSRSQLLFRDETVLNVGPDSRVTLDRFVFDPARGGSGATVSVGRGALRFISGNMPSQSYEIRTPAGSIGVRGTIVDVIVHENGEVVLQLIEGALVFVDLAGRSISLTRPGQVCILIPGREGTLGNTLRPKDRRRLAGLNTAITLDELFPRPLELPRRPVTGDSRPQGGSTNPAPTPGPTTGPTTGPTVPGPGL
jgi:ferric-dicitrate binding protein FerR (iron transport regulator)